MRFARGLRSSCADRCNTVHTFTSRSLKFVPQVCNLLVLIVVIKDHARSDESNFPVVVSGGPRPTSASSTYFKTECLLHTRMPVSKAIQLTN